ncbi:MAG: cation:proton antiporter [Burkholderiales bacterium]|nr:cation:proton antiporter [Burkholderiales bacterium]
MPKTLEIVLVFLASSVGIVALARKLRLPPLLGYLIAGIAIGPNALGFVPNTPETRYLAEFGVVFLMFSIGLEFNLPRLMAMRSSVFGFGSAQVLLTTVMGVAGALFVGIGWQAGVALGGALAMSSTAILVKLLAERGELDSRHGRDVVGVLLFQDLAVVPFLVIVPALASGPENIPLALGVAVLKAAAVLAVLLFAGRKLVRAWLTVVAMRRSNELFVLNLLLMTLGLAYVTEHAGLSLALGAFVAGMLISETEYRHQVEEDIKPFRDVLLGLFFVTIGMLLDIRSVLAQPWLVLLLATVPVIAKFAVVAGLSRLFGRPSGTAIRTGLALAQAGEFGFVLLAQAGGLKLVDSVLMDAILAAMLLSMLAAPFLIAASDRLALRFSRDEWMMKSLQLTQIASRTIKTSRHVIICGYGRNGQSLAKILAAEGVEYMALDLDPERIREAAAAGDAVVYADASRREALMAAGLARAQAVVVTYADTAAAVRILGHVNEARPGLPVIVRVRDDSEMDRLHEAGAAEVVPEALESSLMLASHALLLTGVPISKVVRRVGAVRDSRYGLLRGFFHGSSDEPEDLSERHHVRLHSVILEAGAAAIGKTLDAAGLDQSGLEVVNVRRPGQANPQVVPDLVLAAGDVLVLKGTPEPIALAEERLLRGV